MLSQYTPAQISKIWPILQKGIMEALPPVAYGDPNRMNNILQTLLVDEAQCWVAEKINVDTSVTRYGFCITTITEDKCSGVRNLLIYVLYGFTAVPKDEWLNGFATLSAFAKAHGCHRVVGYTNVDSVIGFVNALGGNTEYTFLSVPLQEGLHAAALRLSKEVKSA